MSLIYLDTSALVKLVAEEDESTALATWLDDHPRDSLCTSVIGKVELLRAARRRGPEALPRASNLIAELALIRVEGVVLELATALEPHSLRTLDALHLASAAGLGADLAALVAYDQRVLDAAAVLGMPAVSPGA